MSNELLTEANKELARRDAMAVYLNKTKNDAMIDLQTTSAGEAAEDIYGILHIIDNLVQAKVLYIDDDGDVGPEPLKDAA